MTVLVHSPDEGGMAACQLPRSGCGSAALWTGSIAGSPGRDGGDQHRRKYRTSDLCNHDGCCYHTSTVPTPHHGQGPLELQFTGCWKQASLFPAPPHTPHTPSPKRYSETCRVLAGLFQKVPPSQVQSLPLRGTRSSQSSAERPVKLP